MKVKCIKKDENDDITIGNIYEVVRFGMTDLDCGMLSIIDDEGDISYMGVDNGYLYAGDKFEIYDDPNGELKEFYERFKKLPLDLTPKPLNVLKNIE